MRSHAIVSSTLAGVGSSYNESEPVLRDSLLTSFHAKYDTRVRHNILVRIPTGCISVSDIQLMSGSKWMGAFRTGMNPPVCAIAFATIKSIAFAIRKRRLTH
jgi:hypothetical protein